MRRSSVAKSSRSQSRRAPETDQADDSGHKVLGHKLTLSLSFVGKARVMAIGRSVQFGSVNWLVSSVLGIPLACLCNHSRTFATSNRRHL